MLDTPLESQRDPADSNAPRIPPGRVILSMRCWLALKSTGLGSLGWAGLGVLAVLAWMFHLDLVLLQACSQWRVPTKPNTGGLHLLPS